MPYKSATQECLIEFQPLVTQKKKSLRPRGCVALFTASAIRRCLVFNRQRMLTILT